MVNTQIRRSGARALVVALVAAIMLAVLSPVTAMAAPGGNQRHPDGKPSAPTAQTDSMCDSRASASDFMSSRSAYLPLKRWGTKTELHEKKPMSVNPFEIARNAGTIPISQTLGTGTVGWQLSGFLTEQASAFCIGEAVSRTVDRITAMGGRAVVDTGAWSLAVVVVLGGVIVAARRRGSVSWDRVIRILIIVCLFTVMLVGAQGTSPSPGGKFGVGSPGWFEQKINTSVELVANAPVVAINKAASQATLSNVTGGADPLTVAANDQTNCVVYKEVLNRYYANSPYFSSFGTGTASISVSDMWYNSGAATFNNVQFGNNRWGQKVGCHLMELKNPEARIVTGSNDTADLSGRIPVGKSGVVTAENAFRPNKSSIAFQASERDDVDRAMVGWAACRVAGGKITMDSAWTPVLARNDQKSADGMCTEFFGMPIQDFNGKSKAKDAFTFPEDVNQITEKTKDSPEIRDYIMGLHGHKADGTMPTVIIYMLSSWVSTIVFALLSLAILIAKIGLKVLAMAALWVLFAGLFRTEYSNKAVDFAKQYIVVAFFAFGTSLLLSVTAMLSTMVQQIGFGISPPGTLGAAVWSGLSPLMAIVLLHLVFTKALKAPSPFKPTSALAYGAVAGSTGLLAGSGLQQMFDRAGSRAKGAAQNKGAALQRKAGAYMGIGSGASRAGSGTMDPANTLKNGAGKKGSGLSKGAIASSLVDPKTGQLKAQSEEDLKTINGLKPGDPGYEQLVKEAKKFGKTGELGSGALGLVGQDSSPGGATAGPGEGGGEGSSVPAKVDGAMANLTSNPSGTYKDPAGKTVKAAFPKLAQRGASRVKSAAMSAANNPAAAAAKATRVAAWGGAAVAGLTFGAPAAAAVGVAAAARLRQRHRLERSQYGGLSQRQFNRRQLQVDNYRSAINENAARRHQQVEAAQTKETQGQVDEQGLNEHDNHVAEETAPPDVAASAADFAYQDRRRAVATNGMTASPLQQQAPTQQQAPAQPRPSRPVQAEQAKPEPAPQRKAPARSYSTGPGLTTGKSTPPPQPAQTDSGPKTDTSKL